MKNSPSITGLGYYSSCFWVYVFAGQIKAKCTFECICTEPSAEGIRSQNRQILWGMWYLCSSQLFPHWVAGWKQIHVAESQSQFLATGLDKGLLHYHVLFLALKLFWCLSLRREGCSSEVRLPCAPTVVCGCPLWLLLPTLCVFMWGCLGLGIVPQRLWSVYFSPVVSTDVMALLKAKCKIFPVEKTKKVWDVSSPSLNLAPTLNGEV